MNLDFYKQEELFVVDPNISLKNSNKEASHKENVFIRKTVIMVTNYQRVDYFNNVYYYSINRKLKFFYHRINSTFE